MRIAEAAGWHQAAGELFCTLRSAAIRSRRFGEIF
jgi:hypothetical protein